MPEWKNPEKPSILQGVDVKAFLYLYRQVRTDFESGRVCFKKMEKDNRWLIPIFNPIQSDSKDMKCVHKDVITNSCNRRQFITYELKCKLNRRTL